MTSPVKLPPLPDVPAEIIVDEDSEGGAIYGQDDDALRAWATAYAEQAVREALAELQPVGCCLSTAEGRLYSFASMRAAEEVRRNGILMNQTFHHLYLIPETSDG